MIREERREEENKWGTVVLLKEYFLKEKRFWQRSKNGKLRTALKLKLQSYCGKNLENINTQMELFELDLLIKGKFILKCCFYLLNIFFIQFPMFFGGFILY